ncbi:MAG: carboxypeptidase regulatory-like domain-containing protein [Kofleriaceae bacterium]|nr:carboxypeptidase regulatory-like domain-containing protein [Kofleriaceae bacterium]MBP9169355.1 carboxypeptidase regulatory-like domain-containing protein [Kofleriaceae bacterium]MBP9862179.1 carboxypeptidase regulatory-like domain-containing protein [Kofleriaceae bacterium]
MARFIVACAVAVAAAASATWAPPRAWAAPTVTIKARADLALTSVRRTDDGQVLVKGALTDRASGAGLGGADISIQIGPVQATAITGPDGTFDATLAAPPGPVEVALAFAGGDLLDAATLSDRVDPAKLPIDMTLSTAVTPTGVTVTVVTSADGIAVTLPVAIRITPAGADQPARELAQVSGRPFTIARADALGPGARRITARFAGDPGHAPATAATVVELASDTAVEAEIPSTAAFDATLRIRGRVLDADRNGVAKVTLTLVDDQKRRLGSATTGADGRFSIATEASLLGTGRHGLVVIATPRETWLRPSQSSVGFVDIGQPRPAPVALTIAAFAATALTAAAFLWARRRRGRPALAATDGAEVGPEIARGGLEAARPGLVSTLRRAADHGFAGAVRDAHRHRPLEGAAVTLTLGAEARTVATSADGRFAHEALAAGEWSAQVSASGHVSERFTVSIPHRGELRGARIDLVPVRERAFAIYRTAALPHLPRPELWGIWSPRQIVDHVRAARPRPALAALTERIEEIYFSGRVAEEDLLPGLERAATAAIAERAAGAAV